MHGNIAKPRPFISSICKSSPTQARTGIRCATAVLALGMLVATWAPGFAGPESLATPEQRRACTPDVYRLCAGEIPNVGAITACLRRKKASLSEACRVVFEQ
jgi:hypothetical protein